MVFLNGQLAYKTFQIASGERIENESLQYGTWIPAIFSHLTYRLVTLTYSIELFLILLSLRPTKFVQGCKVIQSVSIQVKNFL